jgi:MFS family permease
LRIKVDVYYGWWIVWACFLLSFYVGGVIFFGFTAFFEPIREEFGWSYTQVSFATSLRGLEMGLMAPLVGVLVDRFGCQALITAGTFMMGLGLFMLSLTQSLATFYAAFLLLAFGAGGCTSVVTVTTVTNWFRRRLGVALGVMASGFGASGLMLPLIVWLTDAFGWRAALVVLASGMWLLGFPVAAVIRDRPEDPGPVSEPGDPGRRPGADPPSVEMSFSEVLRTGVFWYISLAETIRMMALSAVVTHIMPYLAVLGVDRTTAGVIAAAVPLSSIAGRFGLGWMSDIMDKRLVHAACFVFMALGTAAFCFMDRMWAVGIFLVFFPLGFGGSMVVRSALLRHFFGVRVFGKALGVTFGAASMGGIAGPTIAGWGYDVLGNYQLVWVAYCAFLAVTVFPILRMRR